jgi:pantothenate kinase
VSPVSAQLAKIQTVHYSGHIFKDVHTGKSLRRYGVYFWSKGRHAHSFINARKLPELGIPAL